MLIIIWNLRGGCSKQRQLELKKLLNEKGGEIFQVMEMKASTERFKEASDVLGKDWEVTYNESVGS